MTTKERVILAVDGLLTIVILAILVRYNYWWALVFIVLLTLPALFTYQFLKKKSELLFKGLAEATKCDVIRTGRGYPYLRGNYQGREIQVKVYRNYPRLLAQLGATDPLKMAEKLRETKPGLSNFIAIFVGHNTNVSEIQSQKPFIIAPQWVVYPLSYNVGKVKKLRQITGFIEETINFARSFEEKV